MKNREESRSNGLELTSRWGEVSLALFHALESESDPLFLESRLIASTGLDRTALTAHESYQDQAAAEAWVRDYAGDRTWMACDNAMSTHEDIAPGLVTRRR